MTDFEKLVLTGLSILLRVMKAPRGQLEASQYFTKLSKEYDEWNAALMRNIEKDQS